MKKLFRSLFSFYLLSCAAQQPVDNRIKEIVFKNVNIIPMDEEEIRVERDVVVKNGVIIDIGRPNNVKYSKDALIIDAKGKYLMPGLAEMHAHVPPGDDLEPMKEVLMLFALHGVTTIRGMLGHPRHIELRNKLQSGEIMGPRFITSGPSFNSNSVKTPEAARSEERRVGKECRSRAWQDDGQRTTEKREAAEE